MRSFHIDHKRVQVDFWDIFEAFDVFGHFACDFDVTASDVVAQVTHLAFQVGLVIVMKDFADAEYQVVVVQALLRDADQFGSDREIAAFGLV